MPPRRSPRTTVSAARRPRRPHLRAAQLAALTLAARLRYLTVLLLVLHLGVSPDAAYRLLQQLRRQRLVRCLPWRPGATPGHAITVATLTAAGAHLLEDAAHLDSRDLRRLVKSTDARACAIEAGLITTLGHDLDVLVLHGMLLRATGQPAGVPDAAACHWNLRIEAPLDLDLSPLSLPERALLNAGATVGARRTVTYIPDAVVPIGGGGGAADTVLFVEVETGKRGRPPHEIGAVKAAKMHAVLERLRSGDAVPTIGAAGPRRAAFLVWCPSGGFRDRFVAGARRALGRAAVPLYTATASELPLRPPAGTSKPSQLAWIAATAASVSRLFRADTGGQGLAPAPCAAAAAALGPEDLAALHEEWAWAIPERERVRFDPYGDAPLIPLEP